MRRQFIQVCLAGLLCLSAATVGCPGPGPLPPAPDTITIEYINSANAPILVDLLVSSDPNITQEELLLGGGTLFRDTVDLTFPGDIPFAFDVSCADAQAIIIDRAVLLVTDGPAVGSTILYQGLDYFCGEVVSFEFATDEAETEMFVSVAFFEQ